MTRKTRKVLRKRLSILIAARNYKYYSQDVDEISAVMGVSPEKIKGWMETPEWLISCSYWGNTPKLGDLNLAHRLWTELVEKDEHIHLVEYPEKPIKCPPTGDLKAYALVQSHLFCVDGLCDDEIRARLAEERKFEGNPIQYDGQDFGNLYRWWIYPNWDEGVYSKVLARVNMFGDLVVGSGEETSLVCIRHGRLKLTRQVCDDVANVHDKRLLVCL